MSSEQQPVPAPKGINLTIKDGRIHLEVIGDINEAEFLGFGAYITSVPIRNNLHALSGSQQKVAEVLHTMSQVITAADKQKEPQSCSKDCCSEYLPSEDSGLSTESSPDFSDE